MSGIASIAPNAMQSRPRPRTLLETSRRSCTNGICPAQVPTIAPLTKKVPKVAARGVMVGSDHVTPRRLPYDAPLTSAGEIRGLAERFTREPVARSSLALVFDESIASSVEVLVEGRNFYPPMLEDIASASSSIHINQFGFRPGVVGDSFAEALSAKAREGVTVRLVVDQPGVRP